jgi:uroporphyrinogen-III decarboxylase
MDIWKENSQPAIKQRWEALWNMEDLPRPLWFIPASPVLAASVNYSRKRRSLTALFSDRDVMLEESLKFNKFYERLQKYWAKDDALIHLQPQLGVGVFASAFGCPVEFLWNQLPRTHFAIKAGEPAQKVYELEKPSAYSGLLGNVLDFTEYFEKKTNSKYPIAVTDMQGPMDTAYLVWDSCDFMVAMYEHPKEVHHLMRMCTDLVIEFVKEMRSKVKEFVPAHFPPVYLPDGKGLAVSEDALAVLSAPLYEEFSLPYINELSEEFGGILIHSCGNFEHQLGVLEKVHNLRGINFGVSETRFEAVWEKFGGKTCVIPHCSAEIIVAEFKDSVSWIEHVMKNKTTNKGLAMMVMPVVGDVHQASIDVALGRKVDFSMWEAFNLSRDIRKIIKKYS